MKKKLTMILSVALIAVMVICGTLAYLTSEDGDVNVMTLGGVEINQIEKERVEQSDDIIGGDNITDFKQDKPLYPSVYEGEYADWARNEDGEQVYQEFPTGGSSAMWTDSAKNPLDKIVFVENTGKSDAYVRTWFAFEQGSLSAERFEEVIGRNINNTHWVWEDVAYGVEIDGNTYAIYLATYIGNAGANKDQHVGGVLAPTETTRPSLLQVMMYNCGTNEDVEAIDGNKDGKYDILVVSQGVQTEGFESADAALDTAFGAGIVDNHPFDGAKEKYGAKTWDGTADTSWYNEEDTEFVITTAEQLAGFADLVDGGSTFAGKTVKLGNNIDLYCEDEEGNRVSFDPIGYGYDIVFKGTFDGQGNTISNCYQNGWDLGLSYGTQGGGLFASVVDATIKNVTLDGFEVVMECVDMGALVGYSYGNSTYENITVTNSVVANYNRYTGGVVGEVNGTQTFKNVDVTASTKVSALWGTYDAALGGIVGGKWGNANLTFEDCDVAAELDAFNDVCSNYQWYNYRLSGMLIGNSEESSGGIATASYLTAKNCTVTYGDWVNYTYCEFEKNGHPSYAGEGDWKFSRVQEGYATGGVDADHTHDTDEDHEVLLVFDQLFGGDKGVQGGKTHLGVTVNYN